MIAMANDSLRFWPPLNFLLKTFRSPDKPTSARHFVTFSFMHKQQQTLNKQSRLLTVGSQSSDCMEVHSHWQKWSDYVSVYYPICPHCGSGEETAKEESETAKHLKVKVVYSC